MRARGVVSMSTMAMIGIGLIATPIAIAIAIVGQGDAHRLALEVTRGAAQPPSYPFG